MTRTQLFLLPDEHPINQQTLPAYKGLALADTLSASLCFYDSFDWRLYRAGLCLQEWRVSTGPVPFTETRLINNNGQLRQRTPQTLAECPPDSTLAQLLEPLLSPRVALLQAEFTAEQQRYDLRNSDGKLLARCTLTRYTATANDATMTLLAIDSLRGYEKAAGRLLAALQTDAPLLPCKDPIAVFFQLADLQPDQYSAKPRFKLAPESMAQDALRQVFAWLLTVMTANEPGLRKNLDSEFLHDFRIAIRRTRSMLSAFKHLFPVAATQHFRDEFAWLGQASGPLRDLDVYLLQMPQFQKELPDTLADKLEPLSDYLQSQQKREYRRLVKVLDSARYRKLLAGWRDFLTQQTDSATAPDLPTPSLREAAGERIWRVYRKARKQGLAITPDSPAEDLHELRKTCKKLRYLLDGLPGLYPDRALSAALKPLKNLQNLLGDFQDCSVQVEHLENYAQALRANPKVPVETFMALGVLIDHLERRSHQLREHFAQDFAGFASRASKRHFRDLTR